MLGWALLRQLTVSWKYDLDLDREQKTTGRIDWPDRLAGSTGRIQEIHQVVPMLGRVPSNYGAPFEAAKLISHTQRC